MGQNGECMSNLAIWQEAVKEDFIISGEKYVSDYPKMAKSLVEDFAESIVFYIRFKEKFIQTFPKRSEILGRRLGDGWTT